MKKYVSLFIVLLFFVNSSFSQPGCPSVNAGSNVSLPCGTNCTNLTATAFPSGNTSTYAVSSIPYTPFSYTAGTSVLVSTDDIWSSVINIPFTFCFFGTPYTQMVLGANGLLSFDLSNAGGGCVWDLTGASPIPSTTVYTNSIFGPYHDIDPSLGGTIKYQILGTAPCRIFVLSFNNVPMYDDVFLIGSCWNVNEATHQIALYETTNAIEIYIQNKSACTGWNDGLAIEGIQNAAGTVGYAVPGRNLGVWNASNSAHRFTPNGPSIVTVDWLEGASVIGSGNTVNVCPSANPTTYTARATYLPCNGGTPVVVTSNVNVALAGSLNSSITASTNVSCNGGSNGTATATVSGGNPPITYGWSNGSNQLAISGLSAGTYVFTANDAASCVRRDTVIITHPPPRTLSVPNVTFNNCTGTGNGDLAAISSGGVSPYTYAWSSTTQTDSILNGVAAGTYIVTMTDANLCTSTASGTLTITSVPIVFSTPTITAATCTQGGSITAAATGGVGGLSYTWSNGSTGAAISNLAPNSYTVTATDGGGCSASATYTVGTSGTVVSLQAPTITNVQCNGGNNGAITANGTGGTGTLSYLWSGGFIGPINTGLTAGSYTVTVSDPTGCSASATYNITQPTAIVPGTITTVSQTCTSRGTATASATGGSGSFNYLWADGQTTATDTGLVAGTYMVTITDQISLCTVTQTGTVGSVGTPPNIFVATPAPISCTTPTQTVTATSSTAGATFEWTSGSPSASYTATAPGTYTVTATNPADGCTATSSVTIAADTARPVIVSVEPDTLNCLITTSTLFVATSANNPTFAWSNGNTNQSFTTTDPGVFTVTVTNTDNGCTASYTETVVQDTVSPVLSINTPSELNCDALSVDLIVTTLASPVSYLWSNGEVLATTSTSSAGPYTVTVTNTQNNCTSTISQTVTQNIASPTVSIAPSVFMTCVNPSQTLTATASPATVTYLWSNASNANTTTVSSAGTYTITVEDPANGCTAVAAELVQADLAPPQVTLSTPATLTCVVLDTDIDGSTNVPNATYAWSTAEATPSINVSNPNSYTLTVTNTDNGCTASNTAVVAQNIVVPTVSISTPIPHGCAIQSQVLTATTNASSPTYVWSTSATASSATILNSGIFTVTVTNGVNGCTSSTSQTVVDAPPLVFIDSVSDPLCITFPNSGSIAITPTSGTPTYSYVWSDGSVNAVLGSQRPGTYQVTVSDAQGCTAIRSFTLGYQYDFTIEANPRVTLPLGESVVLGYIVNGNSGILTNLWSPNRFIDCETCESPTSSPLATTLYRIDVENQVGCKASDTLTISVVPSYDLYVPNAFTPNSDGFNDIYEIYGNKKIWKFIEMQVFNRWGEMVYTSTDIDFKWDGRYKGSLLTPQVLSYVLQVTYINGFTDKLQTGTITLIR
jgi:gliding motility-associated-like protein